MMKYSILVNPHSKNSAALSHSIQFIQAALAQGHEITNVFLYGYAVKSAFFNEFNEFWTEISANVSIVACSTIAQEYLDQGLEPLNHIKIAGLAHYMDALITAEKRMEFV